MFSEPWGKVELVYGDASVARRRSPRGFRAALDGTPNPTTATCETVRQDNTGGLGSHNALLYSERVGTDPAQPTHTNNIGTFIGNGKTPIVVDYYGRKAP